MKVIISSDITENTKLICKNIYIITTSVNVINNSTVEVEKDTLILLKINSGNLIFQNGSKLIGSDIDLGLCNDNYSVINKSISNNNKLIFNGNNTRIKINSLIVKWSELYKINSDKYPLGGNHVVNDQSSLNAVLCLISSDLSSGCIRPFFVPSKS